MCYKIHQVNILFTAFQWKHYILLPLESYENFCFSIFTYGRGFPRPFCSFPSTMCLHMACFNKQKIEALKLKFSIYLTRPLTWIFCSRLFPSDCAFALASWQEDGFELHALSYEKIRGIKSKLMAESGITFNCREYRRRRRFPWYCHEFQNSVPWLF